MATYRFGVSVDNLQKMTHNTPLMTQGDVNTALYRLDYELNVCMRLMYDYIPDYVKVYLDSIAMSILKNAHKRYSYFAEPDISVINYFIYRDSKDKEKFFEVLKSMQLFRNEYYMFISNAVNIFNQNKDTISGTYYIRSYFKLDIVDTAKFKEIQQHLDLATLMLEVVEKSFYKKVISAAIGFSNGNPDFVQDNFMEGTEGLRNAIMRFSIYNGGILAGYMGQWVVNKMIAFRAPEIVSGVPADVRSKYNQLLEAQKKRNLPTVADAAEYVGLTRAKAKDIEMIYTKEPNIRIEIATQGIDDESNAPEFMIAQQEEESESLKYLFDGIGDLERKCLCMHFGNFEDYPSNKLSDEDIAKEMEYQSSKV